MNNVMFPRVSLEVFERGLQWDHADLVTVTVSVSVSVYYSFACSFACDCE